MRVFLSYASADRQLAERLDLALRAQGQTVFFDRRSLAPGEEYNAHIRNAVRESELFVFLLSPEALNPEGYARAELSIAESTWGDPSGHVLPVTLRPVRFDEIPPYVRQVTL